MKKSILTMMLALMAMLSMQAQTITGKWITHIVDEEAEEMVSHILVFEGNLMRQAMFAMSSMEGVGDVSIAVTVPAQDYTPGSKVLNFRFDPTQAEMQLQGVDFIDEIKNVIKENPAKEEQLKQIVFDALNKNKQQMAQEGLLSGNYTVVSATDTKLVLKDPEGESMTFIRPE